MKDKIIIGIDLAGKETNPTGITIWRNKRVETCLVYKNSEILKILLHVKPTIVAIDAPLSLPKNGILRKADRALIKKGYHVFPPGLRAMKTLTLRASELNKLITEMGIKAIEVHPTSTRKALKMPAKDWKAIQAIFRRLGVEGIPEDHTLTPHEIDAITAALTAHLHMLGLTEAVGDCEEGFIIVPKKANWREIEI
ncbi:MAG: DUF429 domain-containing protein [Candidatus Bathyarchaeia archaeon]